MRTQVTRRLGYATCRSRYSDEVAAQLIRDVGFDPVDLGSLRKARYSEPFALLLTELACGGKGPELAYRFERFEGKVMPRAAPETNAFDDPPLRTHSRAG